MDVEALDSPDWDLRGGVWADAPPPALALVHGVAHPPWPGPVERALRDTPAVRYRAVTLPDDFHRHALHERLRGWFGDAGLEPPRPPRDWDELFGSVAIALERRRHPLRLVLEGVDRLVATHSRFVEALETFWGRVRQHGLPLHLLLVGHGPEFDRLRDRDRRLRVWTGAYVPMGAADFRQLANHLPRLSPRDRVTAWTVFGGSRRSLAALDPAASLPRNVIRSLLHPDGALFREGLERLERRFQSPERYAALISGLARGDRAWNAWIEAAGLGVGSRIAPYARKLVDLGWVRAATSLDAPPRARTNRYRLSDPFLAFWFRFVLPFVTEIHAGQGAVVWRTHIRPHLGSHASAFFPAVCEVYLRRYAAERLGANARQVGGLWRHDPGTPLAGTLRNGAAFVADAAWGGRAPGVSADARLTRAMRAARWGYGRERRLRILFATGSFSTAMLRHAARVEEVHLIGVPELVGDGA